MIFRETKLKGAYIIEIEPIKDIRGFFARSFCHKEFKKHGLNPRIVQCNLSFNRKKGTLRGIHYQLAPHWETKLVHCTSGSVYDVIVDLRPDSVTYREWVSVELCGHASETALPIKIVYVPEGLAHGFQTLEDNAAVFYQMSVPYAPTYARGVRWNDPAFGIQWPVVEQIISEQDRKYPDFIP